MRIIAIETSCDETGIALVEGKNTELGFGFVVLKQALLSQAALHAPYGGVYPNLAKREHEKNLPILFEEFKNENVDAVAVTYGPGLEPALWTGINFAKKIAEECNVPLWGVNHMEGHLLSSLAKKQDEHSYILENTRIPVLGLLISGGHTEFVLMRDWFEYKIVGETLDDAVGEAFDKVARMLGLPYPGGPHISKLAQKHREASAKQVDEGLSSATARELNKFSAENLSTRGNFVLPRPMLQSGNCDMSFSGLKTAALYALKDKQLNDDEKAAFAREFEDTVADVFVAKTRKALKESHAQTFVIGGGVAANSYIREQLQKLVADEFPDVEMRLPELSITGDNAVMIAEAALVRALSGKKMESEDELRAVGNLSLARNML